MDSDELREVNCDDCCQEVRWRAADYIDTLEAEIIRLKKPEGRDIARFFNKAFKRNVPIE